MGRGRKLRIFKEFKNYIDSKVLFFEFEASPHDRGKHYFQCVIINNFRIKLLNVIFY